MRFLHGRLDVSSPNASFTGMRRSFGALLLLWLLALLDQVYSFTSFEPRLSLDDLPRCAVSTADDPNEQMLTYAGSMLDPELLDQPLRCLRHQMSMRCPSSNNLRVALCGG